ncbi:hypothetical protein DPMN_129421 [Dreissena polymorpha]|uniref:Uncharacterized protein n=1 Tax=Dreissena polymorpha TaxID=45954 RepID=A0A9D4H5Q4_DREPO|nr:hypothetical protein DPMN_129421 [Dreissena polymorpha]
MHRPITNPAGPPGSNMQRGDTRGEIFINTVWKIKQCPFYGNMWRKYGADQNRLLSWGGIEACLEVRGGGLIEGPRDSGTQYAQRTRETASGMKTMAGDSERGHKGRAACLHSFGELRLWTKRQTDRDTSMDKTTNRQTKRRTDGRTDVHVDHSVTH